MPAFNAARFLEQTLSSVRDQQHRELMCCIVDDGSTDQTATIAARFCALDSRFRTVSQPNLGQTAACNRGLAELVDQITFVCFLDADDILHRDAVSTLLRAAELNPTAVGAHGLATRIDAEGNPLPALRFDEFGGKRYDVNGQGVQLKNPEQPTTFANLAVMDTMIPPAVALLRTSAVAQTTGFDPELVWWPDWDLFLRLGRIGDFAFVNQVVVDYRLHDANTSANPKFEAASRVIRVRAFESVDNTDEHRLACRLAWRTVERWHAREHWAAFVRAGATGRFGPALRELAKSALARARQMAGRPSWLLRDRRAPAGTHRPPRCF